MRRNKIMKKLITLIFLITVSAQYSFAQNTTAAFLKLGSGAKALGLANAFVAASADINALAYNPAGINGIAQKELSFTYANLANNLNYSFTGYGIPFGNSVIGIGVNYLSNTLIEGRGANRELTNNFGANDMAINLSYARIVSSSLGLGINIKYIKSEISDISSHGYAFDMGGIYKTNIKGLNFGLSAQNIGTKMKFMDEGDSLPLTIRTGITYAILGNINLSMEADRFVKEKKTTLSAGVEYIILSGLSLRTGYLKNLNMENIETGTGISGGFSLMVRKLKLEYAVTPFGELGDSQRFSMGMKF